MDRHYAFPTMQFEMMSHPDPRCEDAGEKDELCSGLCRRSVGPHAILGGQCEDSEGALQAVALSELYREPTKCMLEARTIDFPGDRLGWSNHPLRRERR
ncbi:hypothetical protein PoB_002413300 [Plakobranchus ocellatus]|uniref:Uncharacterized protein n=1 Tax=Plakobranchus ocellatus TaxID=259542 RepID=A0AAV3ZT50_9GAST|nr:hypothetical protein PoB_002413300 [Plakobranchus ocellatus]